MVYSTRRFVLCLTLCHFVLVFFSPLSIPLGVWEGLRFVIVALPGLFSGLFFAVELGPVFAHLFQQSLAKGEIPKEWPLANICPLYMKGDRVLPSNYRPVSLTCVPCKMLEHIVCTNIMAHLDEHKLLSDGQHAFR